MESTNNNTGVMPGNEPNYVPLPLKIKKNGFVYFQLIRKGSFALYRQTKNDRLSGHEVFRVRMSNEKTLFGRHYPAQEIMPGNERFGIDAWSVGMDIFKAIEFIRRKDREFNENIKQES